MALVEMNEGSREEIRATLDEERNEWAKNSGIDAGHAFMIGGRTQKIIDWIACAKDCAKCARAKVRNVKEKNMNTLRTMREAVKQWKLALD
eukprot:231769-Ditylum_brightwellii.AAC.1